VTTAAEIDCGLLDGPEHRTIGVAVDLAYGPCQAAVAPLGHDTALDAEGGTGVLEGPMRALSYRTIVDDPAPSMVVHEGHDPADRRKTFVLNTQIRERHRRRNADGHDRDCEPSHESTCASKHLYLHATRHDQCTPDAVKHCQRSASIGVDACFPGWAATCQDIRFRPHSRSPLPSGR